MTSAMGIPVFTSRLFTYYSRHGLCATTRRGILALKRSILFNRQLVFCCDLTTRVVPPKAVHPSLKVERRKQRGELSDRELHEMVDFWNPKLALRRIEERFYEGAILWLIKFENTIAGYIWTLQGRTISSFYFPLGGRDVQLFDLFVFPRFRGRAIDCLLFAQVLCALAAGGAVRGFADTGEWNKASVSSHMMSGFQQLGFARKWTIFRHTVVWWTESDPTETGRDLFARLSFRSSREAR